MEGQGMGSRESAGQPEFGIAHLSRRAPSGRGAGGDGVFVPPPHIIRSIVRRALKEDIGYGDLTTDATVPPDAVTTGVIIARASGVIAGLPIASAVFAELDERIHLDAVVTDGDTVGPGDLVARINGSTRPILTGERVALNFLQQLSGVATAARQITDAIEGTGARLLDTRKTAPGLRALQRYAVRVGGGTNHRFNLFDGILIKENHITAAGGIAPALARARAAAGPFTPIEIEVERLDQLQEVIRHGADMVLLDNMSVDQIREAVRLAAGRVKLEASGDIIVERARAIAETGVDFLSSGALTHSVIALNLSLRLEAVTGC
jgi:nicotinate-nucleotide pyrophosphorylase (carboxylating)